MVFVFTICRQHSPLEKCPPPTFSFRLRCRATPHPIPKLHTSNGWGAVRFHKRFTDASDFLPSEGEPPRTASGVCP